MKARAALLALLALLLIAAVFSLSVGRYPVPLRAALEALAGDGLGPARAVPPAIHTVVVLVRLPRVLGAMMVGMALALAGTAYQNVFRNPLAAPSLLGVSSGAAFGAALALMLAGSHLAIQGAAFCGGLVAVGLALTFNRMFGGRSLVTLVLCGLVVAALFQAVVSIIKCFAEPLQVLPAITFWLMGSLAKVSLADVSSAAVPIVVCAALLHVLRWRTSVLALGDDEASALGIEVRATRMLVIIAATLLVATTVSIAGTVGWVGLIVPHAARMVWGLDPDRTQTATGLLGALFLLVVDDCARSIGTIELPLGVLTALVGAPLLLFLVSRTRKVVWT